MQGRQGQDHNRNSWDRSSSQALAALKSGTGRQRAIPQRPEGMRRVDLNEPSPTSKLKAVRPARAPQKPRNRKKRLLILGGLILLCGLLALGIGAMAANLYNASNPTVSASTTANNFLSALEVHDYEQAYGSLDASLAIQTPADIFKQRVQADDHCFGNITWYSEVPGSAQTQDTTQNYDYSITRSKLAKPYVLHLVMKQVDDLATSTKVWKITDYGDDLGPQTPSCK